MPTRTWSWLPGLRLKAYTAEADSPSADGPKLLASWAATNIEPAIRA